MDVAPRHVMVAIDLDELSLMALQKAAWIAQTVEAQLDVVHIYSSSAPSAPIPVPGAAALHEEAAIALQAEMRERVTAMLGDGVLAEVPHELLVLHHASPGHALCELAAERGVDLLVVGSHQRGGLGRILLGSVAERVVRHAPCDVLVVRGPSN